ncbi:MAG: glycosyltransferase family 39 protein [Verrucomicrobiota bacterium]
MNLSSSLLESGTLIRRSLFLVVLVLLTLGNLFTLFRGLNSPHAMDQAQIGREISRGNGFTTKVIRPLDYQKNTEHQKRVIPYIGYKDTYHSPLNPLLNAAIFKMIGADDAERWKMSEKELVFPLDRVVAAISTICFLLSIGVTYLLILRIFDAKIAGVTAVLMLFCETFWNYSLSGLPQMLMLLLFTSGIYFAYRAVEDSTESRIPLSSAIIAGVFFTLLAMTHYLTVWIALGYIIFAAIAFRPRGVVGVSILVILIIPSVFVMLRNYGISGTPFGTAFYNLYNGIGGNKEDFALRSSVAPDLINRGFFTTILRSILVQTTDIIPFLGGIVVAPLFFLSLLHPFKRQSIATFRWTLLSMFGVSALGLALFGVSSDNLDPNQTHLLFAPVMTAYGLAFVSILWNKLPLVIKAPMIRNLHHVIIIIICALPLILSLPSKVKLGLSRKDYGGIPHWPPYFAPVYNRALNQWVGKSQICVSDQPWAIAWYADRMSIWLPPTRKDFIKLQTTADELETPIVGILITPSSHGSNPMSEVAREYKDFTSLVLDGKAMAATEQDNFYISKQDPKIKEIVVRYPYPYPLVYKDMIYYSDRQLTAPSE